MNRTERGLKGLRLRKLQFGFLSRAHNCFHPKGQTPLMLQIAKATDHIKTVLDFVKMLKFSGSCETLSPSNSLIGWKMGAPFVFWELVTYFWIISENQLMRLEFSQYFELKEVQVTWHLKTPFRLSSLVCFTIKVFGIHSIQACFSYWN